MAAAAVAAGFALAGAPSASAQTTTTPTATFCSGESLISYRLRNGAKWEMCWGHHSLKGLVLSKVAFQGPKDTVPKLVLDAINTVQMNVPYDNGNIEYDDVLQYGFGGNYLKGLDVSECPDGELRNATVNWETSTSVYREEVRPALCIREDETGTAYRSQYRSNSQILAKQGTDLIVFATAAIGNYEYEMRYSFHDDGQIDADLGATGEAIPFGEGFNNGWPVGTGEADFLMNHYHSAVWRVDFGLDGQSQMRAEQWDTAPTGQRGTQSAIYNTTKTDIPTEKALNLSNRRWFRVLAPGSLNPDNHARSYEFVYGKNDPYSSYPHLKYELAFTQFRSCEQFPMRNLTSQAGCGDKTTLDYIDGENVTNPVAWVNVGFHHVPRDEDQSPMPIHWQGFSLYPRDWHSNNSQAPAVRSAWNGRTMPAAPTADAGRHRHAERHRDGYGDGDEHADGDRHGDGHAHRDGHRHGDGHGHADRHPDPARGVADERRGGGARGGDRQRVGDAAGRPVRGGPQGDARRRAQAGQGQGDGHRHRGRQGGDRQGRAEDQQQDRADAHAQAGQGDRHPAEAQGGHVQGRGELSRHDRDADPEGQVGP